MASCSSRNLCFPRVTRRSSGNGWTCTCSWSPVGASGRPSSMKSSCGRGTSPSRVWSLPRWGSVSWKRCLSDGRLTALRFRQQSQSNRLADARIEKLLRHHVLQQPAAVLAEGGLVETRSAKHFTMRNGLCGGQPCHTEGRVEEWCSYENRDRRWRHWRHGAGVVAS